MLAVIGCFMIAGDIFGQAALQVDSINFRIDVNRNNQYIYTHELKENETLYSISKFFRTAYQDIIQLNELNDVRDLDRGTALKIPIDPTNIITTVKAPAGSIPVYYIVKRKETLFKISHVYFPQPIQNLINRNDISSFSLRDGQALIVGWWSTGLKTSDPLVHLENGEKTDYPDQQVKPDSIPEIRTIEGSIWTTEDESIPPADTLITRKVKGIAYWDKKGSDFENLFVMHNSAKENSFIRLRNPLTGRQVVAKVIMQIPSDVYTTDIDIVITPAVAQQLGALDSRFRIEMDYYE